MVISALVRAAVAPPAVVWRRGLPRVQRAAGVFVHDGVERARRADVRAAALRVRRGQPAAAGRARLPHDGGASALAAAGAARG